MSSARARGDSRAAKPTLGNDTAPDLGEGLSMFDCLGCPDHIITLGGSIPIIRPLEPANALISRGKSDCFRVPRAPGGRTGVSGKRRKCPGEPCQIMQPRISG